MRVYMKQATFFKLALATNICFLFLIIHKSSRSIQVSYDQQKIVSEKEALVHQQTELTNKLYTAKNLHTIKQFARSNLGMKPCSLNQIKQLASHE